MTGCFIVFASGAKQTPGRVAKYYVILNVVKNPTDELTVHIFLTKVVGYFANAQYDVLFASSFGRSVGNADDRGYTVKLFCIINTRRRSR